MKLSSNTFVHGERMPEKYTCKGEGVSPPLRIEDVPANAESLVLIVHDPDAVQNDFTHWLVWNIASTTADIAEGSAPDESVEGVTDFGKSGYGAPCPPAGTGEHRYIFELYALDKKLELPPSTTRPQLEAAMGGEHIIASTDLIGLFSGGS